MVAMPKKRDTELTGRARVRPGWRGRLVLQVEVKTTIYSACPAMPGRDVNQWREQMRAEGECHRHWRDAAWDDMHALGRLDLVPAGAINPPGCYQPIPRPGPVAPPPRYPNGVQAPVADKLRDLIDRYWSLAYAEGAEGREHDTEDGAAQQCRHEIEEVLRAIDGGVPASDAVERAHCEFCEQDVPRGTQCWNVSQSLDCGRTAGVPDLRNANPIGLTPSQKELQRQQLADGVKGPDHA